MSQQKEETPTKGIQARVDLETYKQLQNLKIDLQLNSLSDTLELLARTVTSTANGFGDLQRLAEKMEEEKRKAEA